MSRRWFKVIPGELVSLHHASATLIHFKPIHEHNRLSHKVLGILRTLSLRASVLLSSCFAQTECWCQLLGRKTELSWPLASEVKTCAVEPEIWSSCSVSFIHPSINPWMKWLCEFLCWYGSPNDEYYALSSTLAKMRILATHSCNEDELHMIGVCSAYGEKLNKTSFFTEFLHDCVDKWTVRTGYKLSW